MVTLSRLYVTKNSDAFGDGCLDLPVELVNADVVDKALNGLVIFLAFKDSGNIDLNEYVVVGGARLDFQFENNKLLRYQVLNLSLEKLNRNANLRKACTYRFLLTSLSPGTLRA